MLGKSNSPSGSNPLFWAIGAVAAVVGMGLTAWQRSASDGTQDTSSDDKPEEEKPKAKKSQPKKSQPKKNQPKKPSAKKASPKAKKSKANGSTKSGERVSDDLTKINGIGPARSKSLKLSGVRTYEQIANWTKKDIDEVDEKMSLGGRIERDDWVGQAKRLAKK